MNIICSGIILPVIACFILVIWKSAIDIGQKLIMTVISTVGIGLTLCSFLKGCLLTKSGISSSGSRDLQENQPFNGGVLGERNHEMFFSSAFKYGCKYVRHYI